MFYRLATDHTQTAVPLADAFAGPVPSACWLIGGGPSLARLPVAEIDRSPLPKMCINLAGTRLLRPTFWTSYDPSARFHRSIYLDPGVMKFVHRRRAFDLVPETTFKVCDCPNLYFFDRDGERGFHNFVAAGQAGIVDWADSFVQAIDLLYRLGFRIIYLAGCELRVRPSKEQRELANSRGVEYDRRGLLTDFVEACLKQGITAPELDALTPAAQYHFGEFKPIRAAAQTDLHYFRVVQYLRLSRRALSLAGLQLISVTPHSRLNDHFPYQTVTRVLRQIARTVGDPQQEPTRGLYTSRESRHPQQIGPMRDFRPLNWRAAPDPPPPATRDPELLIEHEGPVLVPPVREDG